MKEIVLDFRQIACLCTIVALTCQVGSLPIGQETASAEKYSANQNPKPEYKDVQRAIMTLFSSLVRGFPSNSTIKRHPIVVNNPNSKITLHRTEQMPKSVWIPAESSKSRRNGRSFNPKGEDHSLNEISRAQFQVANHKFYDSFVPARRSVNQTSRVIHISPDIARRIASILKRNSQRETKNLLSIDSPKVKKSIESIPDLVQNIRPKKSSSVQIKLDPSDENEEDAEDVSYLVKLKKTEDEHKDETKDDESQAEEESPTKDTEDKDNKMIKMVPDIAIKLANILKKKQETIVKEIQKSTVRKLSPEECKKYNVSSKEVHPSSDCEYTEKRSRTCWFERQIGDSLTLTVTASDRVREAMDYGYLQVAWFRHFHSLLSEEEAVESLYPDFAPDNMDFGDSGLSLRISPILDIDTDYNSFHAVLTIVDECKASGEKKVIEVIFRINIIPIDMGFVYLGEDITINIENYITLPSAATMFEWKKEKTPYEITSLSPNMRVGNRDKTLFITELAQGRQTVVCAAYTDDGTFLAKRRFCIRDPVLPDNTHSKVPKPILDLSIEAVTIISETIHQTDQVPAENEKQEPSNENEKQEPPNQNEKQEPSINIEYEKPEEVEEEADYNVDEPYYRIETPLLDSYLEKQKIFSEAPKFLIDMIKPTERPNPPKMIQELTTLKNVFIVPKIILPNSTVPTIDVTPLQTSYVNHQRSRELVNPRYNGNMVSNEEKDEIADQIANRIMNKRYEEIVNQQSDMNNYPPVIPNESPYIRQ